MNEQLRNFTEALKATDLGTKLVVTVTAVALVAAMAIVGVVSKETHHEVAFSGLTDAEFASVSTAIAEAGIEFETRRGDGVNVVMTTKDDTRKARQVAWAAGAISVQVKGILGSSGAASNIFAGADEREQLTREKDMSEIEKTIEVLDYITQAELYLPKNLPSAFSAQRKENVSMVVRTKGGRALTSGESYTLALTLQGALGFPMDKIMITDQAGRMIHGNQTADNAPIDGRTLEVQREYNLAEQERVNVELAKLFGPDKARVSISSEFDFSQSTVVSRLAQKPVEISKRTSTTETPVGAASAAPGGVAGSSSNIASSGDSWGVGEAALLTGDAAPTPPPSATTSETETASFIPTIDTTEIHNQPKLKRLSISLALDDSLIDKKAEVEANVKAMLGYDATRADSFSSMTMAILATPVPEVVEEPAEAAPAESGLPMDMLIENAIELVTALAFIFLLLKGLKSTKGKKAAAATAAEGTRSSGVPGSPGSAPIEISPEALARAQVEDLVQNNPERVAQILSNWVVEDRSPIKSS